MDKKENWGLLGHDWAVELLKGHVINQRVRHAYLFTGPRGVGRRTLAYRLTQVLNCIQISDSLIPCGECRACRLIEKAQHPDFMIVKAEEDGRAIKVDQIRALQRTLSLAPYEANYKTALILDFDNANPNAANALLKTLEEPPAHVIMLVTASNVESLLPTINSRCEIIKLRPLPIQKVNDWLNRDHGLLKDQAQLLSHISGGRPGYAFELSQNIDALEERQNHLNDLINLLSKSRVDRFSYAEELSKEKTILLSTLQTWLTFWRDVMLMAAGSSAPITNIDRKEEILALSTYDLSSIKEIVMKIERSIGQIENYINARLVTEVLLLELPKIS